MNWNLFDRLRRTAPYPQQSVMEAYQQGKISRRSFLQRGLIVGLSVPTMGAVIAACGGDDDDTGDGGSDGTTAATDPAGTAAPVAGGSLRVGVQQGDANSGLDPLNMLDLGTYAVCSQAFEYLVGLADDGGIGPTSLASAYEPNDDASVWTFTLREGVMWQDGKPFTSADVAATLDRMAEANAGVGGAWVAGSTETPDDLTVVMNLEKPNGNLPVLVSIFNTQSLITPADYANGTVLDDRPTGTGAWMLDSFDPTTFTSKFVPNPNWWGGCGQSRRDHAAGLRQRRYEGRSLGLRRDRRHPGLHRHRRQQPVDRRQRHGAAPALGQPPQDLVQHAAPRRRTVHRCACAPGRRLRSRPSADHRHGVPGRGVDRQRPRGERGAPVVRPDPGAAASAMSRWPGSC